jgi:hypothetical protein
MYGPQRPSFLLLLIQGLHNIPRYNDEYRSELPSDLLMCGGYRVLWKSPSWLERWEVGHTDTRTCAHGDPISLTEVGHTDTRICAHGDPLSLTEVGHTDTRTCAHGDPISLTSSLSKDVRPVMSTSETKYRFQIFHPEDGSIAWICDFRITNSCHIIPTLLIYGVDSYATDHKGIQLNTICKNRRSNWSGNSMSGSLLQGSVFESS